MNIRDAIDELGARVTHEEIARALGVSVASVRQYRLSSNAQAHRSPAPGWQKALAKLARQRGKELQALAVRLERFEYATGSPQSSPTRRKPRA